MWDVARKYGVSLRTAAIAFERLKGERLVVSRTGRGTFVTESAETLTAVELILCVSPNLLDKDQGPRIRHSFARLCGVLAAAGRRHVKVYPLTDGSEFQTCIRPTARQAMILMSMDYQVHGFCDAVSYAMDKGWPVCMVSGRDETIPWVNDNRGKGFEAATAHLLSLGHRRIAYINLSPEGWQPWDASRLIVEPRDGYLRAFQRAGLDAPRDLYMEVQPSERVGPVPTVQAVERLLSLRPRPTAILASNDARALLVIETLNANGVRIPDEISVIGCDNTSESERSSPPLTTINTEVMAQGEEAVNYVLNRLHGLRAAQPSVTPTLVVRESSGPRPSSRSLSQESHA